MITKAEVTARLSVSEELMFKMWEQQIDVALQEGKTWVSFTGTARVREQLMKAYEKAGWTVTYHDDQREGATLTFS